MGKQLHMHFNPDQQLVDHTVSEGQTMQMELILAKVGPTNWEVLCR